jgi:hypothetical protein
VKKRQILGVHGSSTVSVGRAKAAAKSIKASRPVTLDVVVKSNVQQKYLGHFGSSDAVKRAKKKVAAGEK